MPRLIPMPGPSGIDGAALAWINAEHITTAVPVVDRTEPTPRLMVELKMQGHPVVRYWLAGGEGIDLDTAWEAFLALVNGT